MYLKTLQQSLCSEMAEELRFAVRCHGSRQRPALKRSCTRCSPGTTYVPAALELPHINGVSTSCYFMFLEWTKESLNLVQHVYSYFKKTIHRSFVIWNCCFPQSNAINIDVLKIYFQLHKSALRIHFLFCFREAQN